MRWKAHFFLGKQTANCDEKFGLPSPNNAPMVTQLKDFEDDVIKMISNIQFRTVNDPFMNKISKDLDRVNSMNNVLVFADKSKNIYELSSASYEKILTDNVTMNKQCDDNIMSNVNSELKEITDKLSISGVDIMARKNALVTLKDHKENFDTNPKCRLLNPSKRELGKVSKVVLDRINDEIRSTIHVNQWKNTQSVLKWFPVIENKCDYSFLSFNVNEFYQSISEDLLNRAISWVRTITNITPEEEYVIKHARKSLLFHGERTWSNTNDTDGALFYVAMGSYDGAEVCELLV
jgi:hypothetical protein